MVTMDKKNAIIVYVDNNEKCVTEFSWLWKSWLMWDINIKWDLVAFVNPECEAEIKQKFGHFNLKVIALEPLLVDKGGFDWSKYQFVNSFAMFRENDIANDILAKYNYILKTDCDTFLTKSFKDFDPTGNIVYLGKGGQYAFPEGDKEALWAVRQRTRDVANILNLNHTDISHVGASICGKATSIVLIILHQFKITKTLLQQGWAEGTVGHWPGWYKGVASMYAIELAVNHLVHNSNVHQGSFDGWCTTNKLTNLDLHLHAWHVGDSDMFSKIKWFEGNLESKKYDYLPEIAGEYCHAIASMDLLELKAIN